MGVPAAVDWAGAEGIADPERLGIGRVELRGHPHQRGDRAGPPLQGGERRGAGQRPGRLRTDQYALEYEAELGPPWKDLEPWKRVSYPFLNAHRIVMPTLFVCGQDDWNLPLLNSEQIYQALKSLGRETQLVIYPGEAHEIRRPSFVRYRMERYLAWSGRHLGAPASRWAPATAGPSARVWARRTRPADMERKL